MKLRTAIAKSKRRFVLVAFNVSDTHQLEISREQAREVFADYLDVWDEWDKNHFEDANIFAHYDEDTRTLWLG
jgi:hypothetical protein